MEAAMSPAREIVYENTYIDNPDDYGEVRVSSVWDVNCECEYVYIWEGDMKAIAFIEHALFMREDKNSRKKYLSSDVLIIGISRSPSGLFGALCLCVYVSRTEYTLLHTSRQGGYTKYAQDKY